MNNLKLQFIIEAVDRATVPLRALGRQVDRMAAPVRRLRQQWAELGRDPRLQNALARVAATAAPLATWGRNVAGALAGVGVAAAGAAFGLNRVTTRVADIADQAIKVGMTTEELSRLTFAARQSGASSEAMGTGLLVLMQNMEQARDGSKEAAQWLARVGITLDDLRRGITTGQALERMADTFARVGDVGDNARKKVAAMRALMGRGGADLIQLLNGGSAGLRELARESDRVGATLAGKTAAEMKAYGDEVAKLSDSLFGLSVRMTSAALPAMSRVVDKLLELSIAGRDGWAERMGQQLGRLIEYLPALIGMLAGAAEGVVKLVLWVDKVVESTVGWQSVVAVLIGVLGGSALFAVYTFAAAVWALVAAVVALAAPFAGVVAGVAAFAALAAVVYAKWEPIKRFFDGLWQAVTRVAQAMGRSYLKPAPGAPSIYAGADEWARYRAGQASGAASAVLPMRTASGELGGTLRIAIDSEGRPKVRELRKAPGSMLDFDVYTGVSMAGP
ncbi:MAG: hypothetical protein MUF16_01595 [Burkholderiaceae bacterium]|nr:hypothetical protein [Burkholderiaceae bacterium]